MSNLKKSVHGRTRLSVRHNREFTCSPVHARAMIWQCRRIRHQQALARITSSWNLKPLSSCSQTGRKTFCPGCPCLSSLLWGWPCRKCGVMGQWQWLAGITSQPPTIEGPPAFNLRPILGHHALSHSLKPYNLLLWPCIPGLAFVHHRA